MELDAFSEVHVAAPSVVSPVTSGQFVTFTCGKRALAIDIMAVREIRSWTPATQLPGQSGINGVLDIRGEVVKIHDLAAIIGGMSYDQAPEGRVVIVVSVDGDDVGLVVDSVSDIVFARAEDMRPVPQSKDSEACVMCLIKVQDELIAVLHLDALL